MALKFWVTIFTHVGLARAITTLQIFVLRLRYIFDYYILLFLEYCLSWSIFAFKFLFPRCKYFWLFSHISTSVFISLISCIIQFFFFFHFRSFLFDTFYGFFDFRNIFYFPFLSSSIVPKFIPFRSTLAKDFIRIDDITPRSKAVLAYLRWCNLIIYYY